MYTRERNVDGPPGVDIAMFYGCEDDWHNRGSSVLRCACLVSRVVHRRGLALRYVFISPSIVL